MNTGVGDRDRARDIYIYIYGVKAPKGASARSLLQSVRRVSHRLGGERSKSAYHGRHIGIACLNSAYSVQIMMSVGRCKLCKLDQMNVMDTSESVFIHHRSSQLESS